MTTTHKVGELETITYQWRWHNCDVCDMPACWEIGYLFIGTRSNPASKAYGRDDCSWSQDAKAYACKKHRIQIEHDTPDGMKWNNSFLLKNFKHLGFYKVELK